MAPTAWSGSRSPTWRSPRPRALGLPTFEVEGRTFYKRLTLIAVETRIVKVFYPVFPPDRDAADVLAWLRGRATDSSPDPRR